MICPKNRTNDSISPPTPHSSGSSESSGQDEFAAYPVSHAISTPGSMAGGSAIMHIDLVSFLCNGTNNSGLLLCGR